MRRTPLKRISWLTKNLPRRKLPKSKPPKISFIKIKKTTLRTKLDPLDILFSEYIRKSAVLRVGGCERCLTRHTWKQLQNAHFNGRADKSTRWDEDNCWGLCTSCHDYLDDHHHEFEDWVRQKLGEEKFLLLQERNRVTYPKPDKQALKIYYQAKIKGLDKLNNLG